MKIKGIITAMVSPLNDNGIDEKATRLLVNHLIEAGVNGLFILGTNGEFYALSREEKEDLAKIVVQEAKGRVPVFAGAGGISTADVIDLSQRFDKIGVDAVSVITPFLIKISDRELLAHYEQIAWQTSLPLILYNIPAITGLNISKSVYHQLLKIPSIIAIKDSSGHLDNLKMYIDQNKRDDFSVLVGSDSNILAALRMGADGAVAATSNVLTRTDLGIYEYFTRNDLSKAQELQNSIENFRRVLKMATPPSVLKYSLNLMGYSVGLPKRPVLPVAEEFHDEIKRTLYSYKNIEHFNLRKETT